MMRRKVSPLVLAALGALAAFALDARPLGAAGPAGPAASSSANVDAVALAHAMRAQELTLGLDYDDARRELSQADGEDPAVLLERGRIALYEADCDAASLLFARPDVAKTDAGAGLGDIARGCARVTAALVVDKDANQDIEIRYQDEADRAMTPLLVETVVRRATRSRRISA